MQKRPPFIDIKPIPKRFWQRLSPFFYFVLCLTVGAFLVWIYWRHEPARLIHTAELPKPKILPATNSTVSNPPPRLVAVAVPQTNVSQPKPHPVPESVEFTGASRPVATMLEAQIALARLGISSGSIDGVGGSQTRSALAAFQRKKGLEQTGTLDGETKSALTIALPVLSQYTITSNDLARLMKIPKTWLEKSQQPRLDFETITELLGEKAFCSPHCVRSLNPNVDWTNVTAGTTVMLPNVSYPPAATEAAMIKISLKECVLEAFDEKTNLLAHFPCSIGRVAEKRPAGQLHVAALALDPNYTFDPAVFPESEEAQTLKRKLIIPPGPNNPVGVAWIGLDKPGYGIHGTPAPEQVGRTESHGCFRLANWNAAYLAKLIWIGMPVFVDYSPSVNTLADGRTHAAQ